MAAMAAERVVELAIAECEELGVKHLTAARGPLWLRITQRQQQLHTLAAGWSDEFAGAVAREQIVQGEAEFSDLLSGDHPTVPAAERITRIEVADAGTSAFPAGTEVNVVRMNDTDAAFAPRAILRSTRLVGFSGELTGVAEVRIYYVKRPRAIAVGTDLVELRPPFDGLLVMDLAKHLLVSAAEVTDTLRERAIAALSAREEEALAMYEAHVRGFAPLHRRHAEP